MTNTRAVQRINPSSWSSTFRYDQAQLRSFPAQLLTLAGQGSITADGIPVHDADMVAQVAQAMDNVQELLGLAGMDLGDVLQLTIHVTDMDAALAAYGEIIGRLDAVGATPPATLVEVSRLAIPSMLVEITATAGRR
ncbi:RidA family protein [uncultured Jatrophihabitans sp.]|uniref:RidA family protein n=1 Tax=uncultured Jatrophihabitans sp. TaxID=1610747 RepID=UPI0035CC91C6